MRKHFSITKYDSRYKIFFSAYSGAVYLNNLTCFIHGLGFIPITLTPHFSYAKNLVQGKIKEDNSYTIYLKKYYPDENLNQSLSNFRNTFIYVQSDPTKISILVSKKNFLDKEILVIDGVHRAAILAALGYSEVKCYICI